MHLVALFSLVPYSGTRDPEYGYTDIKLRVEYLLIGTSLLVLSQTLNVFLVTFPGVGESHMVSAVLPY